MISWMMHCAIAIQSISTQQWNVTNWGCRQQPGWISKALGNFAGGKTVLYPNYDGDYMNLYTFTKIHRCVHKIKKRLILHVIFKF